MTGFTQEKSHSRAQSAIKALSQKLGQGHVSSASRKFGELFRVIIARPTGKMVKRCKCNYLLMGQEGAAPVSWSWAWPCFQRCSCCLAEPVSSGSGWWRHLVWPSPPSGPSRLSPGSLVRQQSEKTEGKHKLRGLQFSLWGKTTICGSSSYMWSITNAHFARIVPTINNMCFLHVSLFSSFRLFF